MSAVAGPMRDAGGWRRPSLPGLTWAVLGGEVLAAVVLWIAGIVLSALTLAPLSGGNDWVWLPWSVDGPWSLVGAVGWGYVVCSAVAVFVGRSIEQRGIERPSAAWLAVAIAITGYGSMAVGRTVGTHMVVAVLAGAVLIRLLAFRQDGSARSWRPALSPRLRLELVLLAVVAGLSYSALHPFAADGSGSSTTGIGRGHPGLGETVSIGLSRSRVPVDITAVTLTGPGAARVSVTSLVLSAGSPETVMPAVLRRQPGADHFQGYVWHPTRLPYRLGGDQGLWITARVRLRICGLARVTTLRLGYTILGIETSQAIPLQSSLTLRCGR